jgi:hypothetical protein
MNSERRSKFFGGSALQQAREAGKGEKPGPTVDQNSSGRSLPLTPLWEIDPCKRGGSFNAGSRIQG